MTPEHKALVDAEASFEKIRTILVSYLNEPERSAFWEAVSARNKIRETLSAQCAQPQAGEPVAERIADAVLSWMVKFDLLDAGNEYGPEDVLAVLNDLAPASPQPANPAQVTDAMVTRASSEYQEIFGKYLLSSHARRILTAAIGADGQAVVDDEPTVKMSAAGMRVIKNTQVDHFHKYAGGIANSVYDAMRRAAPLSQPHPADERVVEALRMAHSFISREYHDAKSVALEGEWVSKDARPVFRALSDALAQEGRNG